MPSRKNSWTKAQRATFIVAFITATGVLGASLIGILPDLVSTAHPPTAQTLLYSGRVQDAATGQPVSGAKVTLEIAPVPLTRYTDAEGVYLFNLPNQSGEITARITITHPAYHTYERVILFDPKNRQIDVIRLTPITPSTTQESLNTVAPNTTGVWEARFYNNPKLEGSPIYQTTIPAQPNDEGGYSLDFNPLTAQVPGLASANYSIRWVGFFDFTNSTYEFHCEHRDGCRVYVDDRVWIDAWWDGAGGHDLARKVVAGQHMVIVEFYDKSGVGHLEVLWRKK